MGTEREKLRRHFFVLVSNSVISEKVVLPKENMQFYRIDNTVDNLVCHNFLMIWYCKSLAQEKCRL